MKRIILSITMTILVSTGLQAQTFSEWFRQKKTQKQYLLQQIAALKVYSGYVQKGYSIAKNGLRTISGFTRGEFDLHGDYFNSLKIVNPVIRQYPKVAEIIEIQLRIIQCQKQSYHFISASNAFTTEELDYFERVYARLLNDCEATMDELLSVTTGGKLEMKDDERISRIDKLYLDMQDNLIFCQSFGNDVKVTAAERIKEKREVLTSRALQGIKNE